MAHVKESIMRLASGKGICSTSFLERSVQSLHVSIMEVSNAIQELIVEGKLCKIESENGQEFLCTPMNGRGIWEHEDPMYAMDEGVAADMRCALLKTSGAKRFKEAFDDMFASKIGKELNEEENKRQKTQNQKNRTNVHLDL